MKKYKFKPGFKSGSISKVVPGVGLVCIDENICDEHVEALLKCGVKGIFEEIKTPKLPNFESETKQKDGKEKARNSDTEKPATA